jgi:hypothetical protein
VVINPTITGDGDSAINTNASGGITILRNLHIQPTWNGASGTGAGIYAPEGGDVVLVDCVVEIQTGGSAGSTTAINALRNLGTRIWAYRCLFLMTDTTLDLSNTQYEIDNDGTVADLWMYQCEVRRGQIPGGKILGNIRVDNPTDSQPQGVKLHGTKIEGEILGVAFGRVEIYAGSSWGSLGGTFSDDDTEDHFNIQALHGYVQSSGQQDQYKSNYRDLAGDPGNKSTGDVWRDGNVLKLRAAAADVDLTAGSPPILSKSITVESPGASEDISVFFSNLAITITEIRAVVRGTTPSVTWTVRHGTDRSAAGAEAVTGGTTTTSQSTGSDVTAFNDATIVADSFVWLETTAQTGTVDEMSVTIVYTED